MTGTQSAVSIWFDKFKKEFALNFIKGAKWKWLVNGLSVTIQIAVAAVVIGIILGALVAIVRTSYEGNKEELQGFKGAMLKFGNGLCSFYLTVIRGTPVVVQLMIMYYIIFASSTNGQLIATVSFGINSGAYVAEIFRSGISSVERGQFEAGRSLGMNYVQTMWYIIIPQAIKNCLPALANEFITLLKETSVAGYVTITDLTRAGDLIRGNTFSPFMPLFAVALIYLVMVVILTHFVGILEKRLRKGD